MKITFIQKDGTEKIVEGQVGDSLLDLAEANGLPLFGGCGGSGICGSCRVRLDPDQANRLPSPDDAEQDTLDAFQSDELTRLACQVRLTESCEGIRIYLV